MKTGRYTVRVFATLVTAAAMHLVTPVPASAVRACSQCVDGTQARVSAPVSCAELEEQICRDAGGSKGGTFRCPCRSRLGVCAEVGGRIPHGLCVAYCETLECGDDEATRAECAKLRRARERRTTEPFPCEAPAQEPPSCGDAQDADCGGGCDEGTVCAVDDGGNGCVCVPELIPCGESQPGMCGGLCPAEMPNCLDFGTECMCWF